MSRFSLFLCRLPSRAMRRGSCCRLSALVRSIEVGLVMALLAIAGPTSHAATVTFTSEFTFVPNDLPLFSISAHEEFIVELAYDSSTTPFNVETSRDGYFHFFQADYEPLYFRLQKGDETFEWDGLVMTFRDSAVDDPVNAKQTFEQGFLLKSNGRDLYRFWNDTSRLVFFQDSPDLSGPMRLPNQESDFSCVTTPTNACIGSQQFIGHGRVFFDESLLGSAISQTSLSVVPEPRYTAVALLCSCFVFFRLVHRRIDECCVHKRGRPLLSNDDACCVG